MALKLGHQFYLVLQTEMSALQILPLPPSINIGASSLRKEIQFM